MYSEALVWQASFTRCPGWWVRGPKKGRLPSWHRMDKPVWFSGGREQGCGRSHVPVPWASESRPGALGSEGQWQLSESQVYVTLKWSRLMSFSRCYLTLSSLAPPTGTGHPQRLCLVLRIPETQRCVRLFHQPFIYGPDTGGCEGRDVRGGWGFGHLAQGSP